MPKENKQTARRNATRSKYGSVSQWPSDKRLEYHLTEAAMHIQMCSTIVDTEKEEVLSKGNSVNMFLRRRKNVGELLKEMYKILEINSSEVIKQSHTWE